MNGRQAAQFYGVPVGTVYDRVAKTKTEKNQLPGKFQAYVKEQDVFFLVVMTMALFNVPCIITAVEKYSVVLCCVFSSINKN